jgi:hypothetical protein
MPRELPGAVALLALAASILSFPFYGWASQDADQQFAAAVDAAWIALAPRRNLKTLVVVHRDTHPSLQVGTYSGYRAVFRWDQLVPLDTTSQRAMPAKPEDRRDNQARTEPAWFVELALFPADLKVPADLKDRIPWEHTDQKYFTHAVYMGTSHEFDWFANTTLFAQDFIRKKLGLEGGDSRARLAVLGLSVVDPGHMTANSVDHVIEECGDEAVATIREELKQNNAANAERVVGALSRVQTDASSNLLVELYKSENEEIAGAAKHTIRRAPYRREFRDFYYEALEEPDYDMTCAAACVEFRWRDAIPILETACGRTGNLAAYRRAYDAMRALQREPVLSELEKDERLLVALGGPNPPKAADAEKAMSRIVACPDKQAAALVGIQLSRGLFKANETPIVAAGDRILKKLPRSVVASLLRQFMEKSSTEWERGQYREILERICR